jgi:hypothetical protein
LSILIRVVGLNLSRSHHRKMKALLPILKRKQPQLKEGRELQPQEQDQQMT